MDPSPKGSELDTVHRVSQRNLKLQGIFSFSVEFVGMPINDLSIPSIEDTVGGTPNERAKRSFDETGTATKSFGAFINSCQKILWQGNGGFDSHHASIFALLGDSRQG